MLFNVQTINSTFVGFKKKKMYSKQLQCSLIPKNKRRKISYLVWLDMNRWKLKTSRKISIILEDSLEYTSNEYIRTKRCQHVTGWIWKH